LDQFVIEDDFVWIGARNRPKSTEFSWVSTNVSVDYNNWIVDNVTAYLMSHQVDSRSIVLNHSNRKWYQSSFAQRHHVICQLEVNTLVDMSTNTNSIVNELQSMVEKMSSEVSIIKSRQESKCEDQSTKLYELNSTVVDLSDQLIKSNNEIERQKSEISVLYERLVSLHDLTTLPNLMVKNHCQQESPPACQQECSKCPFDDTNTLICCVKSCVCRSRPVEPTA